MLDTGMVEGGVPNKKHRKASRASDEVAAGARSGPLSPKRARRARKSAYTRCRLSPPKVLDAIDGSLQQGGSGRKSEEVRAGMGESAAKPSSLLDAMGLAALHPSWGYC